MSSSLHQPLAIDDISAIRTVLRHTGFRYEEPLCELDRGAARHAMRLYQNGSRKIGPLISAVNDWADAAVLARASLTSGSARS